MRLELYQAETVRLAAEQTALLDEARDLMATGRELSPLERSGVLHALQVLAENAIGKAKHWLKARGDVVPVSAYEAFSMLSRSGMIEADELPAWNAMIGLRNRIVHDYMNLDMARVLAVVAEGRYRFVTDFLRRPYPP